MLPDKLYKIICFRNKYPEGFGIHSSGSVIKLQEIIEIIIVMMQLIQNISRQLLTHISRLDI